MLKVVFPHAFNFNAPVARLIDVHSRGVDRDWMQKRAAVLTDELKSVRPEKGHSFIHLITMGAQEYYGANRNGDGFNEKSAKWELPEPKKGTQKIITLDGGLMQGHRTFTKYAHVYKDHVNKDPDLSSGSIHAEAYNPEMHRGELIIKVSNEKFGPELEKLASGDDIAFSMSCKVPYDICSICGNRAPSRKEYCDHLKNEMGRVKEAGHQVFAINDRPLFFDISSVFRPADRIAYGLRKVASAAGTVEEFIPSAQLAELLNISAPRSVLMDTSPRHVQEKLAAMERMAAMEKQIEATGRLVGPELGCAAEGGIDDGDAETMRSVDWNELMGTLSQAKICLPVRDFFRLILGDKYNSVAGEMDSVQSLLPGIFGRMLDSGDEVEDVTGMKTYDPGTSLVPKSVRNIVDSQKPGMSLEVGPARRRMSITVIKSGGVPQAEIRKFASDMRPSNQAKYLAKQYAAYQLAFVRAAEGAGDGLVTGLAVMGNYN